MKKRFSEEQIVKMIQEHKQGKSVSEISQRCNKKLLKPGLIKTIVNLVLERFGLSVRKTCKILGINRSTYLYEGKPKDDSFILEKMKSIIAKHPRAGCNSITMYLHKDGIVINHKRVE